MLCSAEMARKRWIGWLALVAGSAFALRAIHLAAFAGTPLADVLIGDAQQYDQWAERIAAGDWLGSGVFYQAPLYPYLLAVIYTIAGHSLPAVRVVQALLGAVSCVLLALAGRRFVGGRAGLVAGALLAVYPPAIFFDGLLQKSSIDLLLVVLLLALLGEFMGRAADRKMSLWLMASGLALGAFMLNRENARLLYPVVLAWLWLFFRPVPARTRAAWLVVFTLGVAAAVLPVGLRNLAVGGEFAMSTSQAGPNFYIGNRPGASGSYEPLVPGRGNAAFEQEDATRLAEAALGRKLSAGDVSGYWFGRAADGIRRAPGRWLALLGRKALLTINAAEVVDTESIEVYREFSPLLRVPLNFGVILAVGAAGAWLTRREWRPLALLYAVASVFLLSVALFYVVARYRYPVVPVVLLLAGAAVARAPSAFPDRRAWIPAAMVGAGAAVLAFLPVVPSADETSFNIGAALLARGRPAESVAWLERAAAAAPGYAPPHFNLGVAYGQMGDRGKSLAQFAEAARLRPDDFEAQSALALARRESGDPIGAVAAFREAVRLRPDNAKAQFNLGNALQAAGDLPDAILHYQEALRVMPDYAEAHSNLALALRESGNLAGAVEHLQAAARLQPGNAAIAFNLLALYTESGHCDEAASLAGTARALGAADSRYAQAAGAIDRAIRECRATRGR